MIDCSEHQEELLAVRDGRMTWDEILAWRLELERAMAAAYARTLLPEHPDYERADRLLIAARRSRI